ncbi:60S ribosomal export protein NMD3 [Methanobrevibacter filiformis]|uniref:NMD3 family protein n=1 Tax=Methanobrevibacter filiformis TaxID=55758 RepID=A0A165ZPT7_9EURY|nr:60S ribosomal export protein NMD3 [Methanobrevibacter filiformis]KZX11002.1 NMD3 family protein [Methanobrevibacter filiformis]
MFCHECGDSDDELIEGLCKDCFLKQLSILTIPQDISVTVCAHCNSKLENGKWKESYLLEDEIIYRVLENAIEINQLTKNPEIELEILQMRGTIAECYIEAKITIYGREVIQKYETNVRLNKSVCTPCSKRNSGYYETVIQLRADSRELTHREIAKTNDLIKKSLANQFEKDKLAYLAQKTEMKEGIDYYFGSSKSGRRVANEIKEEFGAVIKESPRLITQDKSTGKGLYRVWISVRLPNFQVNDFIEFKDKIAQVASVSGSKIIAINLKTFEEFSIQWRDYDDIEVLGRSNEILKTTLISKSPNSFQILNPITYEVIELPLNKIAINSNIGDEVNVIGIENEFYLINN